MSVKDLPPGRELDALIAEKVMGQTDFGHAEPTYNEITFEGGDGWSGWSCPRCGATEEEYKGKCAKQYSTDIAAAWGVLDKITEPDKRVAWEVQIRYSKKSSIIRAKPETRISVYLSNRWDRSGFAPTVNIHRDAIPEAICLAALEARRLEQQEGWRS